MDVVVAVETVEHHDHRDVPGRPPVTVASASIDSRTALTVPEAGVGHQHHHDREPGR